VCRTVNLYGSYTLEEGSSKYDFIAEVAIEVGDIDSVLEPCVSGIRCAKHVLVGVAWRVVTQFTQEALDVHSREQLGNHG
jgi:hypothetical protein